MASRSTCVVFALVFAFMGSAPAALAEANVRFVVDAANTGGIVNGNVVSDLEIGDEIRLVIEVENPDQDAVTTLFTFVDFDAQLTAFTGSSSASEILIEPGFGGSRLTLLVAPEISVLDPTLLVGLAYASSGDPTSGTGPDHATVLSFEVVSGAGAAVIAHRMGPLDCSVINGAFVVDCRSGLLSFGPPIIVSVPEPRRSLLLASGLAILAGLGRVRRRRAMRINERATAQTRSVCSVLHSRRRLVRACLAASVFVLALGGGEGAQAQSGDVDGDLVPDSFDNCLISPNGPNDPSNQVDTDLDGYGNVCDPDFDQNGVIDGADWNAIVVNFNSDVQLYDLTGDGYVTGCDMLKLYSSFGQTPGPSGLACADPTIDVAAGDPPCTP